MVTRIASSVPVIRVSPATVCSVTTSTSATLTPTTATIHSPPVPTRRDTSSVPVTQAIQVRVKRMGQVRNNLFLVFFGLGFFDSDPRISKLGLILNVLGDFSEIPGWSFQDFLKTPYWIYIF